MCPRYRAVRAVRNALTAVGRMCPAGEVSRYVISAFAGTTGWQE